MYMPRVDDTCLSLVVVSVVVVAAAAFVALVDDELESPGQNCDSLTSQGYKDLAGR